MDTLDIYAPGDHPDHNQPSSQLQADGIDHFAAALSLLVGSEQIGDNLREFAQGLDPGEQVRFSYGLWTFTLTRSTGAQAAA